MSLGSAVEFMGSKKFEIAILKMHEKVPHLSMATVREMFDYNSGNKDDFKYFTVFTDFIDYKELFINSCEEAIEQVENEEQEKVLAVEDKIRLNKRKLVDFQQEIQTEIDELQLLIEARKRRVADFQEEIQAEIDELQSL
jgi:hypothetical protein